jgi:hypothetical protein
MKVMPGVLGQVGQNVADNLFEIGKSAVKGTVGAAADIATGSVEQITGSPKQSVTPTADANTDGEDRRTSVNRKAEDNKRFQEVRTELARYTQRKKELDRKIAEEKMAESQQEKHEDFVEKKKRDNWVNRIINRSQTGTERGRSTE